MEIVIGILGGAAALGLVLWLRSRNITVTWYEWTLGIIGMAGFVFTIQNIFGSLAEGFTQPAYWFLLIPGLPAVILIALAWQLAWRRNRSA